MSSRPESSRHAPATPGHHLPRRLSSSDPVRPVKPIPRELARFSRPAESPALAFLVYGILIPVLVPAVVFVLSGVTVEVAGEWGASESVAIVAAAAVGLCSLIGIPLWALRGYRWSVGAEFAFHDDRLEIARGPERMIVPYAEVASFRLVPSGDVTAFRLKTRDGRQVALPESDCTFEEAGVALARGLLPRLKNSLLLDLEEGRTASMRERRSRSAARLALGLLLLAPVPIACILLPVPVLVTGAIFFVGLLFRAFRGGIRKIRRGRRGLRGGFVASLDGLAISDAPRERTVPWRELSIEKFDDDGLVLRSVKGAVLSVSVYAENYLPLSSWIQERVRAEPRSVPGIQSSGQIRLVAERIATKLKGAHVPGSPDSWPSVTFVVQEVRGRLWWDEERGATGVTLHLRELSPGALELLPREESSGAAGRFGSGEIQIGLPAFGQAFTVSANPSSFGSDLLAGGRRDRIAEAITCLPYWRNCRINVTRSSLVVRVPRILSRELDARHLVSAAAQVYALIRDLAPAPGISWMEVSDTGTGRCQVCGGDLCPPLVACAGCGTLHHGECWDYVGACSIFACGKTATVPRT